MKKKFLINNNVSALQLGVIAELIGRAWLIEQGYLVFPNESGRGPIDAIALKLDEEGVVLDSLFVDIKITQLYNKNSVDVKSGKREIGFEKLSRKLTSFQKKAGVKILIVYRDGKCELKI